MIDVISGGRLISGFVRGIGAEYHSFGVNPTFSHERFHEAHDLIVRAWTEPGPFPFQGKHYKVQYVNLWPRPTRSRTRRSGSRRRAAGKPSTGPRILGGATPTCRRSARQGGAALTSKMYRDTCSGYGYEAQDSQLGWSVPVYVAETDDARAARRSRTSRAFRNVFVKMRSRCCCRRGTTSRESLKNVMQAKAQMFGEVTHRPGDRARAIRLRQRENRAQGLRGLLERHALRQPAGAVPVRHAACRADAEEHGILAREVMPRLKQL